MSELKNTNPKDAIGSGKLPLHLWPATASALGSLGLLDGMLKYGRSNWRVAGVRASIYVDAAKRHLDKWFEGQDNDADSGLPHFAHALACLAILVDAEAAGKLNDDRMVAGGYHDMLDALTPHVARLKALHASKDPRHYTIADSKAMGEHAARETDSELIVESNASAIKARQFRNRGGFKDDTDYIQVQPNGDVYVVKRNGFSEKTRAYDLDGCLAYVAGGDWIELEAA